MSEVRRDQLLMAVGAANAVTQTLSVVENRIFGANLGRDGDELERLWDVASEACAALHKALVKKAGI